MKQRLGLAIVLFCLMPALFAQQKAKLKNMSEILSLLSTDKLPMGPAIIGVSEIENYRVLEDILKSLSFFSSLKLILKVGNLSFV